MLARLLSLTWLVMLAWSTTANANERPLLEYGFDELQGDLVHDLAPANLEANHPLDLKVPAQQTSWRPGRLELHASANISSPDPPQHLYSAVQDSQAFTLELWIKPTRLDQSGPARIFSLSQGVSQRNLTIGQDGDKLDVRLRHSASDANGLPSLATPVGSLQTEQTHAVVTLDPEGNLVIYINGTKVAAKKVEGDLKTWDHNYRLFLGNESSGDRPWYGAFEQLAFFDSALSADEIAARFQAGPNQTNSFASQLPPAVDRPVDFVSEVQPILRDRCYECHTSGNEEGGLNLGLRARTLEGGVHGPAIEIGNSSYSLLIHLVSGIDTARQMPPDEEPLTDEEIGVLRAWIDQGANWPASAEVADARLEKARDHWAFQRLRTVAIPPVTSADDNNDDDNYSVQPMRNWVRTPVDNFVARQLQAKSLPHALPLKPESLVRRLTFNLTGLPPTPEQIERFVADYDPNHPFPAEKFINELLDSPHYGERWGRHWLDVARFAESDGQESDEDRPQAYRYRDFVIKAFNTDMPFNQFVRWQIAGDEYEPTNDEAIVATGFLTAGPHSNLGDTFIEEEQLFNRYNELDDVISTVGSAMLGLTVACARCHDHKYDAFSAREYYRLLSVFHSGDRKKGKLPSGEEAIFFQDFDRNVKTTWYFRRANYYDRELEVQLGFPAILSLETQAADYWQQAQDAMPSTNSTLQRRALAEWMVDVDHGAGPLLARVIVNRVWQHHFGHGLVRTSGDFGVRGDSPTHPELLEYLTHDFVTNGWRIKRLHQLILNSATWQQGRELASSSNDPTTADPNVIDLENRYLWKQTPQRLEAEIVRDSMLAVSGTLNPQVGGPSFKPYIPPEANLARNLKGERYPTEVPDSPDVRRRSIYMFHKRLLPYPLLQAFDRPDLLVSCSIRQNTTVAPQALALMNDPTVRQFAGDFARRLESECGSETEPLVRRAFLLALGRQPTAGEVEQAINFISDQRQRRRDRGEEEATHLALTDFCQVIFGLNEFLYVD